MPAVVEELTPSNLASVAKENQAVSFESKARRIKMKSKKIKTNPRKYEQRITFGASHQFSPLKSIETNCESIILSSRLNESNSNKPRRILTITDRINK